MHHADYDASSHRNDAAVAVKTMSPNACIDNVTFFF